MKRERFSTAFDKQQHLETSTIVVNGVRMPYSEYKKKIAEMRKAKDAETKKTAKRASKKGDRTAIEVIPEYIKALVRHTKVLKSLSAYYDNGYKQWGTAARDVIQHPMIKASFIMYRIRYREMVSLIDEISNLGKRNEKNIFQYVEKLSWKIDDISSSVRELMDSVDNSRVCDFCKDDKDGGEQYGQNREEKGQKDKCINETGRRLGLRTLMRRALLSMSEMNEVVGRLEEIAKEGMGIEHYTLSGRYIGCNY